MSVQMNNILLVGVKLPYGLVVKKFKERYIDPESAEAYDSWVGKYDFDKYKPKIGQFVSVFDGMNGNYVMYGVLLNCAEAHEHTMESKEFDVSLLYLDVDCVRGCLTSLGIKDFFDIDLAKTPILLHSFIHYS